LSYHWPFSKRFSHQNSVCISFLSMLVTCTTYCRFLDFTVLTILDDLYKMQSFSLHNIVNYLFTSSLLGSHIVVNTLFPNTSSLILRNHISHLCKTTGKIIVLYISWSSAFQKVDAMLTISELGNDKHFQNLFLYCFHCEPLFCLLVLLPGT
jgi:hypothetical protein